MHSEDEITEFFSDEDEYTDPDCELRIVLLIENTSCTDDVLPEHGLSIYIDFNGKKGLYDAGQTEQLIENAENMDVDLSELSWIAVSHGHYDHTGGLKRVLEERPRQIRLFTGKTAFKPKFARRDNDVIESIGIPFSKEEIQQQAMTVTETGEIQEISENIYLVGPAPMIEEFEAPSRYMLIKDENDEYTNDLMTDERTLVIRTSKGLVIITGCAHRGSVNITKDIMSKFPDEQVLMVLGGFHLGKTDEESIYKRIYSFRDMEIGSIGLCHCTGAKACRMFKEELGERCFIAPAGSEILI